MTRFFYLILLISYYINFFYLWLLASILVNLTILCTIRNSCKMSTESFGLFYNFFYFMYVFFNEIYFYVSKSCQIYHITGYIFLRASNYVGDKKINPIKMCLIFLWSSIQILQNIKHVKCTLYNGSFEGDHIKVINKIIVFMMYQVVYFLMEIFIASMKKMPMTE